MEGDQLTFAVVAGPANGTLSGTAPNLTYTPAANFAGSDSFTFAASDGAATSAPATVAILVTPVNDTPTTIGKSVTTAEDTSLSITLTGGDADGDPLTFAIVAPPQHGTLTGIAPDVTYVPNADFSGADSFTYAASDSSVASTPAVIAVNVTPVNDAPVARADVYATAEEVLLTVTLPGVLANDGDVDGDVLSAVGISKPAHGTLTLVDNGSFTYLPAPLFAGSDTFTYQASDGLAESAPVTVTINVHAVNHAPVCTAISLETSEDVSAAVSLACTDRDGDTLDITVVAPPGHGTLMGSAPGLTYVPADNYHGADQFSFRASDGAAASNAATVSVTVTPVNDAPRLDPIADRSGTVGDAIELVVVASDIDGDALHFAAEGLPAGLSINPVTGMITGVLTDTLATAAVSTPHAVTVKVDDGHGANASANFQWTVELPEDPGGQSSYPLFLPAIVR